MMLTVNDAFSLAGTHSLMASPGIQHESRGSGIHCLESAENVYMSVDSSDKHVSLLSSWRLTECSMLAGGSRTGRADTATRDNIKHDARELSLKRCNIKDVCDRGECWQC